MSIENRAMENMALIQQLFQAATIMASETPNDAILIAQLEQQATPFISIAYEASAMERALLDFNNNDFTLQHWQSFLQKAPQHSAQIHIGLGWAIAKRRIVIAQVEAVIAPHQIQRVLDGVGYCEGTFKQRIAVKEMKTPEWLNERLRKGYDQGLGRSLWYTAKAEPEALTNLIAPFAEDRKPDLWRGVGIALAYVGGSRKDTLLQLKTQSGTFFTDLSAGVALAVLSRSEANTINADTELTCETVCGVEVTAILPIADKINKGISI